jgi:hypothetical protein
MALTHRRIDLTFQLGKGDFGEQGIDTVTLSGLKCSATISRAGGVSMTECSLRVFGMPLNVMNKLTVLNKLRYQDQRFNQVTVSAGDDKSGMSVVFVGVISEAWIDASAAPDVSFVVVAQTGLLDLVKPVPPTSYDGSVDVATVISGIAAQMVPPRQLENSGVSVRIANPYLVGTLIDQLRTVARAADINCIVDDSVVAIWPNGAARGARVPLISADTGMIGYPLTTQNGIQVSTLYDPSLAFGLQIHVQSSLTPANGGWTIASVTHDLETETPNGKWQTRVECGLLGQTVPIVQ